jgi:hypothetical protein
MEFQLSQQLMAHHRQGCRFYGISRQKSRISADFPLLFGRFLGRINRASVEYAVGAGRPGISLRFTNIVPLDQSPVAGVMAQILLLGVGGVCHGYDFEEELAPTPFSSLLIPQREVLERLEMTESAIIFLYREGRSSPWDLTEDGWSHATVRQIPRRPDIERWIFDASEIDT